MAETNKTDARAMTESPEFLKAVQEQASIEAKKAVASAMAEMGKTGAGTVGATDEATRNFFSLMALQIAEISDQGTNRKRVAPEILARRAEALERCENLIRKAYKDGLKPEYRVISKVYFNERLIEPYRRNPDKTVVPQEIVWTGVPNDALRPINKVAEEIFQAYRESVGSTEKLRSLKGSHGGIVAPDNRPVWMTPGGLVVKGDAPPKAFVAPKLNFGDELEVADNNDPNAPEVRILGTIAAPVKRSTTEIHRTP